MVVVASGSVRLACSATMICLVVTWAAILQGILSQDDYNDDMELCMKFKSGETPIFVMAIFSTEATEEVASTDQILIFDINFIGYKVSLNKLNVTNYQLDLHGASPFQVESTTKTWPTWVSKPTVGYKAFGKGYHKEEKLLTDEQDALYMISTNRAWLTVVPLKSGDLQRFELTKPKEVPEAIFSRNGPQFTALWRNGSDTAMSSYGFLSKEVNKLLKVEFQRDEAAELPASLVEQVDGGFTTRKSFGHDTIIAFNNQKQMFYIYEYAIVKVSVGSPEWHSAYRFYGNVSYEMFFNCNGERTLKPVSGSVTIWIVLAVLLVAFIIAGAVYFFFFRNDDAMMRMKNLVMQQLKQQSGKLGQTSSKSPGSPIPVSKAKNSTKSSPMTSKFDVKSTMTTTVKKKKPIRNDHMPKSDLSFSVTSL